MNEKINPKNSPVDDWTVSPITANPPPEEPAADWGMTNPLKSPFKETPKDGWKMPEPQFRVSEGYCPIKNSEETPTAASIAAAPASSDGKLENLYAPPMRAELPMDATMHNISLSDLKADGLPPTAAAEPLAAQPQPEVSDQFLLDEIEPSAAVAAEETGRPARTVYAVLGIVLMIVFAAAFLVLVYYLFFYKPVAP